MADRKRPRQAHAKRDGKREGTPEVKGWHAVEGAPDESPPAPSPASSAALGEGNESLSSSAQGARAPVATLGYALLGVLARGPASGYDVSGLMKLPVGFFWSARHSQIYPELAALLRAGLVTVERIAQTDRPAKKVYTLTAAGEQALRAWVASPMDVPPVRDELVLRAYCIWLADPPAAVALFAEHAARHEAQLAEYQRVREWMEEGAGGVLALDTPDFGSYASLMRGIGFEREYAEWCRWMVTTLQRAPRHS